MNIFFGWFLFCWVLASANLAFSQEGLADNQDDSIRYQNLKIFSNVLNAIEKSYVRKISSKQLIQGAINGMLKELDPHSHFLSEEQLKQFKKEVRGQFSGLGLELTIKKNRPVIISVLENSPARKANLLPGQIILQINGKKTLGLNKIEVSNMLKGHRGKEFHFTVKGPDSKKIHQARMKSQFIAVKSVVTKDFGNGKFYIRINAFTERTAQEIRTVMDKYIPYPLDFCSSKKSGHKKSEHGKNQQLCKWMGVILDLRSNPGGVFDSAIKVADLFMATGTIVSVKGRLKSYEKIFKAHSQNTFSDFPMLVLIDAYSASAAEVLAGALKENKRALLLGQKSFGKGSVQSLVPVDSKNAIKLTVAHYYTPKGNSIHKKGIMPDIEFSKASLTDKLKYIQFASEEDTDFQQALYLLKMFRDFSSHKQGVAI